jgi:hypothetical protein
MPYLCTSDTEIVTDQDLDAAFEIVDRVEPIIEGTSESVVFIAMSEILVGIISGWRGEKEGEALRAILSAVMSPDSREIVN